MLNEINPNEPTKPLPRASTNTKTHQLPEDEPPVLIGFEPQETALPPDVQREASVANLVAATEIRETPPLPQNKKTILVVDDDTANRTMLSRFLQDYNIITASNGKDALNVLSTTKVDLIVSDNDMPEMDGIELSKQRPQNIPFVLISGRLSELNLSGLNINAALEKPLGIIKDLIPTAKKLLETESKS